MAASKQPTPTTAELWANFSTQLRVFLHKRLPAEADVDDVLQDIFIRIHRNLPQLKNADHIHTWLYTIARRTIADYYRAQYRHNRQFGTKEELIHTEDLSDTITIPGKTPTDIAEIHQEVLSWLQPLINNLPEKYRTALSMSDIQGLTQQDVAAKLGLTLPGVKSRIQRARKQLADMLNRCCELEFGEDGTVIDYEQVGSCPPDGSCNSC